MKKFFNFKVDEKEEFFKKLGNKNIEDLNIGVILQRIFLLESKIEFLLSMLEIKVATESKIGREM